MIITAAKNLVFNYTSFFILSPDAIDKARSAFATMQEHGVIKENCRFEDDVWQTTDQYSNVGLHFKFNLFCYTRNYQEMMAMSFADFMDCVKAFIISFFGKNALLTIQSLLLDLRHIIETPPELIYAVSSEINIYNPHLCEDFFSQLPNSMENEDLQRLADAMDSYAESTISAQKPNQRTLADFESYFIFDEYLGRFWNSPDVPLSTKLFFAPLYIWWILTAVLPLRPKEFLVIARNCLTKQDGKYLLHIRRTKLKGGKQSVNYNLSDDYIIETYIVPDFIGALIEWYIELTEDYPSTEIDTLFRTVSHYERWGHQIPKDSRFLTYTNMRTILRYFYTDVLNSMFGLQTVCLDEGVHLEKGQISRIHLGDARHIALINLMHSGGTPMLAMFLAGHANQEMAAHYYSNVEKLIECRTYLYSHKMLSNERTMQIIPYQALTTTSSGHRLNDSGSCYSEQYKNGQYDDCANVIGPNGEIGYCPSCSYYRAPGISRYAADDIYKRKIKDDCDGLIEAIEIVRSGKGNGDIEEIGEALLKVQASTYSFDQYKREKLAHEVTNNG